MKISKFLRNKVNETYITKEFTELDLAKKLEELANSETK
jgi:hypothetical protein